MFRMSKQILLGIIIALLIMTGASAQEQPTNPLTLDQKVANDISFIKELTSAEVNSLDKKIVSAGFEKLLDEKKYEEITDIIKEYSNNSHTNLYKIYSGMSIDSPKPELQEYNEIEKHLLSFGARAIFEFLEEQPLRLGNVTREELSIMLLHYPIFMVRDDILKTYYDDKNNLKQDFYNVLVEYFENNIDEEGFLIINPDKEDQDTLGINHNINRAETFIFFSPTGDASLSKLPDSQSKKIFLKYDGKWLVMVDVNNLDFKQEEKITNKYLIKKTRLIIQGFHNLYNSSLKFNFYKDPYFQIDMDINPNSFVQVQIDDPGIKSYSVAILKQGVLIERFKNRGRLKADIVTNLMDFFQIKSKEPIMIPYVESKTPTDVDIEKLHVTLKSIIKKEFSMLIFKEQGFKIYTYDDQLEISTNLKYNLEIDPSYNDVKVEEIKNKITTAQVDIESSNKNERVVGEKEEPMTTTRNNDPTPVIDQKTAKDLKTACESALQNEGQIYGFTTKNNVTYNTIFLEAPFDDFIPDKMVKILRQMMQQTLSPDLCFYGIYKYQEHEDYNILKWGEGNDVEPCPPCPYPVNSLIDVCKVFESSNNKINVEGNMDATTKVTINDDETAVVKDDEITVQNKNYDVRLKEIQTVQSKINKLLLQDKVGWTSEVTKLVEERADLKIKLARDLKWINNDEADKLLKPTTPAERDKRKAFGEKVFPTKLPKIEKQSSTPIVSKEEKEYYSQLAELQKKINQEDLKADKDQSLIDKLADERKKVINDMQSKGYGASLWSQPEGMTMKKYWEQMATGQEAGTEQKKTTAEETILKVTTGANVQETAKEAAKYAEETLKNIDKNNFPEYPTSLVNSLDTLKTSLLTLAEAESNEINALLEQIKKNNDAFVQEVEAVQSTSPPELLKKSVQNGFPSDLLTQLFTLKLMVNATIKQAETTVKNMDEPTEEEEIEEEETTEIIPPTQVSKDNPEETVVLPDTSTATTVEFKENVPLDYNGLIVVLDPGHGGIDSGAVSKEGDKESELNFQMAEKIKEKLEEKGFAVFFTRKGDYQLYKTTDYHTDFNKDGSITSKDELYTRTIFANNHYADLFISLHHNSNEDASAQGTEIYIGCYCDNQARNNNKKDSCTFKKDDISIYAGRFRPENLELYEENLIKNEDIGRKLAAQLQGTISSSSTTLCFDSGLLIGLDDSADNQYYPQMPAVLIELGYLSNEQDLANIKNEAKQDKAAIGVAEAVSEYFEENNQPESNDDALADALTETPYYVLPSLSFNERINYLQKFVSLQT